MSPQAVRVRTSSGWQDIALQGAVGPPGATPSAKAHGLVHTAIPADSSRRTYLMASGGTIDFNSLPGTPFAGGYFTAPASGKYLLGISLDQFTVAGTCEVIILKNDATIIKAVSQTFALGTDAGNKAGIENWSIVDMVAGDFVKFHGFHSGGGSPNLIMEAIKLDASGPGSIVAPPGTVIGQTLIWNGSAWVPAVNEAWINATLLNGWTNWATFAPAGYFKDLLGIVHLRGVLQAPNPNVNAIFNLPVGYRLSTTEILGIPVQGGIARADLLTSLAFQGVTAGSWVSLSGLTYVPNA